MQLFVQPAIMTLQKVFKSRLTKVKVESLLPEYESK